MNRIGCWGLAIGVACAGWTNARAQAPRYEHRVAVATTSLETEAAVEGSLERNVNLLGAAGYEVTAIAGGQGAVLDRLLERKPYSAGLVDPAGHVFVVMSRPRGAESRPREFKLLHTRTHVAVSTVVEPLGAEGYRLVASSVEGQHFHAAFERTAGPSVSYRVLSNAGRTSWMAQLEKDPVAMSRLSRVVPMSLDAALVELLPDPSTPGAVEWFTVKPHEFSSADSKVQARAAAGYRVQMVRVRGTDVDVLLAKPAGASPTASYSLEDAPWGMPCTRGAIVGADVFTDGDTYCVVDQAQAITNRGFDVRVRPEAGGRHLLEVPGCEGRAALGSSRASVRRLLVASQLERLLDVRTPAGFRVTRLLVGASGASGQGEMRLTVFVTEQPPGAPAGQASPAPRLAADRDELLGASAAALEERLTSALTSEGMLREAALWVEVIPGSPQRVRLAGCAQTNQERALAESSLRGLLVRTAYDRAEIRNDVIVDPWR